MTRERMDTRFSTEQGKMSEREVRDAIDRSAQRARAVAEMNGQGSGSTEKHRDEMRKLAERDHREGKI